MHLETTGIGITIGNVTVPGLMFADDLVMLADSAEDLQRLLDIASDFAIKWRYKYNTTKTEVVIFNERYAADAHAEHRPAAHVRAHDAGALAEPEHAAERRAVGQSHGVADAGAYKSDLGADNGNDPNEGAHFGPKYEPDRVAVHLAKRVAFHGAVDQPEPQALVVAVHAADARPEYCATSNGGALKLAHTGAHRRLNTRA